MNSTTKIAASIQCLFSAVFHPSDPAMKTTRTLRAFLCIVILLLIGKTHAQEIVIFGNEFKPPKYYLEDGIEKGILIDIMRRVDGELPCTFKYELYPWKRAYANAEQGKGGIIGLSKNDERLQKFDFSDVMYFDTLLLVVLKGKEFNYKQPADLRGKLVGVQRGSSYGDVFETARTHFKLIEDGSGEQRLQMLLRNRIDVAIIGPGEAGLRAVIKRNPELEANKESFVILPTPFATDANYLAFAKTLQMQNFLIEFNKSLAEAKQAGDIQKIIDIHMSVTQ